MSIGSFVPRHTGRLVCTNEHDTWVGGRWFFKRMLAVALFHTDWGSLTAVGDSHEGSSKFEAMQHCRSSVQHLSTELLHKPTGKILSADFVAINRRLPVSLDHLLSVPVWISFDCHNCERFQIKVQCKLPYVIWVTRKTPTYIYVYEVTTPCLVFMLFRQLTSRRSRCYNGWWILELFWNPIHQSKRSDWLDFPVSGARLRVVRSVLVVTVQHCKLRARVCVCACTRARGCVSGQTVRTLCAWLEHRIFTSHILLKRMKT